MYDQWLSGALPPKFKAKNHRHVIFSHIVGPSPMLFSQLGMFFHTLPPFCPHSPLQSQANRNDIGQRLVSWVQIPAPHFPQLVDTRRVT